MVVPWENTKAKSSYSFGRVVLGFDFSVAAASSVAVVSLAVIGELFGMNRLLHRRSLKIALLSRALSKN